MAARKCDFCHFCMSNRDWVWVDSNTKFGICHKCVKNFDVRINKFYESYEKLQKNIEYRKERYRLDEEEKEYRRIEGLKWCKCEHKRRDHFNDTSCELCKCEFYKPSNEINYASTGDT